MHVAEHKGLNISIQGATPMWARKQSCRQTLDRGEWRR